MREAPELKSSQRLSIALRTPALRDLVLKGRLTIGQFANQ